MKYIPVIGLEIHSELKTESKMFCDCLNDPEAEKPNFNICPVCTAQPGSLPVINKKAVISVIKAGLALGCKISSYSKFDRKNYFYPDLPKGYQISQYDFPLCGEGGLEVEGKKIRITRIHLEEDTGKLIHPKGADHSLVDFNRAGVPLMELVTEPDITSGKEARLFCEELRLILRYLGVSEANMEKGQMRCEVNISLKNSDGSFGTKVEIKNLNSFRAVEKSIDYEIKRQAELLDEDNKVIQETRGWNEDKQKTFSQREKEGAKDYRYFPEPDLPPLNTEKFRQEAALEIPELPQARRQRFAGEYKIPESDIDSLVNNKVLADFFESAVSELDTWIKIKSLKEKQPLVKLTANYLLTEIPRSAEAIGASVYSLPKRISPENFAEFIAIIGSKEISSSAAQTILKEMFESGADPSHIVESRNLKQVSDEGELSKIVKKVIAENPKAAEDYKKGKGNSLQFLIGKVMAASKGQANPEVAKDLLMKLLS